MGRAIRKLIGMAAGILALTGAVGAEDRLAPVGHPRLFFDASDLPRLHQVATTQDGQRAMATLTGLLARAEQYGFAYHAPAAEHSMQNVWATGYGLLYQLNGDRAAATRAQELCRGNLFGNYY